MCPDTELLSAYYDEELDRFREAKIAGHVSTCSACQAKLARFSVLSSDLRGIESIADQDIEASMDRSWHVIQSARQIRTGTSWNRRVAVPVPFLAAAAAVLVGVFGLGVFFSLSTDSRPTAPPVVVQAPTAMSPVDFQVNNLTDLLNYLNSKDLGTNVTIRLPKGVDQLAVGKPQLLRAADFARGQ